MGEIIIGIIVFAILLLGITKLLVGKQEVNDKRDITESKYFIKEIMNHKYKKAVLANNYHTYTSDKENSDAREYIEFLEKGVLKLFEEVEHD
ncbi:MAG: hypothetical protein R3Y24_09150 [Eubacteriales bacterium]